MPSDERNGRSNPARWHRVGGLELPSWALARDQFFICERRGWRRDLAEKLGVAKNNLVRLLANPAPSYRHYLGLLAFLEERGVGVVIRLPENAQRRPGAPIGQKPARGK